MRGLTDKRVVITGGGSGIGRATATRFIEERARVIVLDVDREACERVERELRGLTGTIVTDVADPNAVQHAFAEVERMTGGLDVLVNNAGISMRHAFAEIALSDWERVIDVNLHGVFIIAQQAARRMLASGGGVILNMGSTNALRGYPLYADYNASKAAVVALTQTMALELAPTIRVNAVCPGYILTPMQQAEYTPDMIRAIDEKIPLGRHGRPEEVAALFAYLASDEAAFVTGQTIVIDGGEIAGGLASR